MDTALHVARVTRNRRQITHEAPPVDSLPDGGAMVLLAGVPALILQGGQAFPPYTPEGYGKPSPPRPTGTVTVLTPPPPSIATLSAGFRPVLHPSCAL